MCFNNGEFWIVGYGPVFPHSNLYKSTDFGESFDSLFSNFEMQPTNNSIMVIGDYVLLSDATYLKGIIESVNNGQTWEQTLFRENILSVFADEEGLVIAGADSVYISSNYGDNWSGFTQPVMDVNYITDIKKDNSGKYFFGTTREGLYEVDIVTGVEEYNYSIPEDFMLYQNYPNPFNIETKIKYEIFKLTFVTLKVFDILGREITTLVNAQKPVGAYETTFDASNLSSGVYIYRLTAWEGEKTLYSQTKQMILLK